MHKLLSVMIIYYLCRPHWDSHGKPFVAGNVGGVRYADPSKNGPEELQYSHTSQEIVKGMFKHILKMSVPNSDAVEHFDLLTGGIADHINENISGAAEINAVKEGIEESGIIALELDDDFIHSQRNKRGPQYFYMPTKLMKFNGETRKFEMITDLVKQIPRRDIDFNCLDHDLSHTVVVHIDNVFRDPDFDIIPTHKDAIQGAIAHYKYKQSLLGK